MTNQQRKQALAKRRMRLSEPPQPVESAGEYRGCVHLGEELGPLFLDGHTLGPPRRRCLHRDGPEQCVEQLAPDELHRRAVWAAECGQCAACPLREPPPREPPQWAVGVCTTARPRGYLLGNMLDSLAAAGWSEGFIFADGGGVELPPPRGYQAVVRPRSGALCNFISAAAELLARFPDAAHILLQDDVLLCANVRQYLEARRWPADACLLKLLTHGAAEPAPGADAGWHEIGQPHDMKGAQGYLFPPGRLEQLLAAPHLMRQRRAEDRPNEAIDNVVARWARSLAPEARQYVHLPSLLEHTGQNNSTLRHNFPRAPSWPGRTFDCRRLAEGPLVTCVMVTRESRRQLAVQSARAFLRQTYPRRELLVILERDIEGPPGGLLDVRQAVDDPAVRQVVVEPGRTLGELRNLAFEHAGGRLLCQWDDDDYSTPQRLAHQVAAWRPKHAVLLQRQLRADLYGGGAPFVFDKERGIEGTILHERATPFRYPETRKGEDTVFAAHFPRVVLQAGAELYVRFFHGANTWSREHILEPSGHGQVLPASTADAALVDALRLAYPAPLKHRWRQLAPQVHGWAHVKLCELIYRLACWQAENKLHGGLLEIGVHFGRTLLPLLAGRGRDQVVAVDPWPHQDKAPPAWRYNAFQATMRRLAGTAEPAGLNVLCYRSRDLAASDLRHAAGDAPHFRLAHIDGSHQYHDAVHDLDLAQQLLHPWGLLLMDDVCNPRWPAVGAAFWRHGGPWWPVANCGRLLVAKTEQAARRYRKVLEELLADLAPPNRHEHVPGPGGELCSIPVRL